MQSSFPMAIPEEAPFMTLSGVALFPGALLPLYIFEPRYRTMLDEVLAGNRVFGVAGLDDKQAADTGIFEPPYSVGTLGVIRASHRNDDGTSNLFVQGMTRVRLLDILREEPYRVVRIEPLSTIPGADPAGLKRQKTRLIRLMREHERLGGELPSEMMDFLNTLEDPDTVIDIAVSILCPDHARQQKLLETLETHRRYANYLRYLNAENARLALDKRLRGDLKADEADRN